MHTAIDRFLHYLQVERNASDLTVKSYREDLTALADYLTEARDGQCPTASDVSVLELRGFVAGMTEAGYAKTTVPDGISQTWQASLTGRITPPVTGGNLLLLAERDAHTVHAFDADTGSPVWQSTAGGRIDSPPTVHGSLV